MNSLTLRVQKCTDFTRRVGLRPQQAVRVFCVWIYGFLFGTVQAIERGHGLNNGRGFDDCFPRHEIHRQSQRRRPVAFHFTHQSIRNEHLAEAREVVETNLLVQVKSGSASAMTTRSVGAMQPPFNVFAQEPLAECLGVGFQVAATDSAINSSLLATQPCRIRVCACCQSGSGISVCTVVDMV